MWLTACQIFLLLSVGVTLENPTEPGDLSMSSLVEDNSLYNNNPSGGGGGGGEEEVTTPDTSDAPLLEEEVVEDEESTDIELEAEELGNHRSNCFCTA